MIPNCRGCEAEYDAIIEFTQQGLHFAGKGLSEKGHLLMTMVDNKGEIIVE